MKKLLLFLALPGTMLLSSCKKEETPTPPAAPACMLSKLTSPSNAYTLITRNSAGKYLTVRNYSSGGGLSSTVQYEYSGDRVSKIAYFQGANDLLGYNTYEKTGYGELVHQWVPAGGLFVENGQWEYHMSNSRINKVITKGKSGSTWVATREDVYTFDGNGNVTSVISTDLQSSATSTTTYTYDNKKSPYSGDFNPDPAIQSPNNITKKTLSSGSSESYTFTYNNSGYAATRSTVGNTMSTYTFEYTGCN